MYNKQTWIDGTSIANAERLNHIEDGIYDNSLDNVYSTSETDTGKVWIDGKPIYRKVITNTTPESGSVSKTIGTISNIESLVSLIGNIYNSSYGFIPIPFNVDSNNNNKLYIDENGNVISENNNGVWQNKTIIVIVEYTKSE